MKKGMIITLSVVMVAFMAGVVSAQTAAPRTAVVKQQTNAAQSKAAQKAAKKALKEQEKAAKARAKEREKAAKATARAKAQAAKNVKSPVVTVRQNAVATSTESAAETNAFAAFESTFVAPDAVSNISGATEQAAQDVLSPSAPRS